MHLGEHFYEFVLFVIFKQEIEINTQAAHVLVMVQDFQEKCLSIVLEEVK